MAKTLIPAESVSTHCAFEKDPMQRSRSRRGFFILE